jgi:hypothetical protein
MYWDVALDAFEDASLHGQGAGTYQLLWAKDRPPSSGGGYVRDAHSLYTEVLGELGIVGLLLLAGTIVTVFFGFARGIRGPNRTLYGVLLAAGVAWALHAAVDWDWEMPVVTIWVFALGGAALAARSTSKPPSRRLSLPVRALIGAALTLLALVPAHVGVSQGRLDESLDAYRRGDCRQAIDSARSSSSVLGSRPQPYEVIGYCYLRQGADRQAVGQMEKAVERDPDNWVYRYDLALAQGASGLDPRSAARAALRLNPLEPLTQEVVTRFQTSNVRKWQRTAKTLEREVGL